MSDLLDIEYYEDPLEWGKDQFISLESIIQNIRLTADDDSYFKHLQKFSAIIHGKQILKDLKLGLDTQKRAISIQVPPSLVFPYPKGMTDWNRVSLLKVVDDCRTLYTLNINNRPAIKDYLQDHNAELLYDNDGNVLEGKTFDAVSGDCNMAKVLPCGVICEDDSEEKDYSKSWVKADRMGGYFQFSDDLEDEPIVIEFIASGIEGLDACDVKVHKELEMTVTNGIKWKVTEGKRNIGLSQPTYFYQQYKKAKEKARDLLADKITLDQIVAAVNLRYN